MKGSNTTGPDGVNEMLGFGAIGEHPIGSVGSTIVEELGKSSEAVALSLSAIITPDTRLIVADQKVAEGRLVSSTSFIWMEIAKRLASDWTHATQLTPDQWEEMVAGAFKKAGYHQVIITPRSGDHGRDIIATTRDVGCVKILGSVKAYGPGNLVPYDAVRSLVGVISADPQASKGIIATTSDFPPRIGSDPSISPFLPTRLELLNGQRLRKWLSDLIEGSGNK
jgi:restriction system protein